MLGVILCGGLSSRMGTDKGLLKSDTVNWARSSRDKLALLKMPVVLSINSNQYDNYSSFFGASELIKDNVSLKIRGPLCGVLSVHLQHPNEDLFILACDMPIMNAGPLRKLITKFSSEPLKDAYLFADNGEAEPLCGIYKARALAIILQSVKADLLERQSMKFIIEHMKTLLIPIAERQKKYFTNVNTHAELNGL